MKVGCFFCVVRQRFSCTCAILYSAIFFFVTRNHTHFFPHRALWHIRAVSRLVQSIALVLLLCNVLHPTHASAATTVGLNISTGGTLTVSGATALQGGATISDATLLDLSSIQPTAGTNEGFKLPQASGALGAPSSGVGYLAYRTDTSALQYYDGAAWITVATSTISGATNAVAFFSSPSQISTSSTLTYSSSTGLFENKGGTVSSTYFRGGGVLVGNKRDETYLVYPVMNQFQDNVSALYGGNGASYYQEFSAWANWTAQANYNSIAVDGLSGYVSTDAATTSSIAQMTGVFALAQHLGSGQVRTDITASRHSVSNEGSGGTPLMIAGQFGYANTGSGSSTSAMGIQIQSPSNSSGNNNITNAYGMYIQPQNRGTNKWQIYSEGTQASYFAGKIGIGYATTTQMLEVLGTASSTAVTTGGLAVGTASTSAAIARFEGLGAGRYNGYPTLSYFFPSDSGVWTNYYENRSAPTGTGWGTYLDNNGNFYIAPSSTTFVNAVGFYHTENPSLNSVVIGTYASIYNPTKALEVLGVSSSTGVHAGMGSASTTLSENGNILTTGNYFPASNNTSDIGAFSRAFRDIYSSGTIYSTALSVRKTASGTVAQVYSEASTTPVLAVTASGTIATTGLDALLRIDAVTSTAPTTFNIITANWGNSATGATNTIFRVRGDGQIFSDAGITITSPADLAELTRVEGDVSNYPDGTIVAQSPDAEEVAQIADQFTPRFLGVATDRGVFMGSGRWQRQISQFAGTIGQFEAANGVRRISLTGYVKMRVNDENGPIAPGDPLGISSVPGEARRAGAHDLVIGMARASFPPKQDAPAPGEGSPSAVVSEHGVEAVTPSSTPSVFGDAEQAPTVAVPETHLVSHGVVETVIGNGAGLAAAALLHDVGAVATLTGGATLAGLLTTDGLLVEHAATVAGDLTVRGHTTFQQDTAGLALFLPGSTTVSVQFTTPFSAPPLVTVTPRTVVTAALWVDGETNTGFVIHRGDADAAQQTSVVWHALAVADPQLSVSDGGHTPVLPTDFTSPLSRSATEQQVSVSTGDAGQKNIFAAAIDAVRARVQGSGIYERLTNAQKNIQGWDAAAATINARQCFNTIPDDVLITTNPQSARVLGASTAR